MRLLRYLQQHRFSATVIATVVAVAVAGSLATAGTRVRPHPLIAGPIDYEATTAGAVIEGINSGSGVGVEGVANTTSPAGAIALQGFGTSTTAASVGVNGSVSGPSSTALIGNANNTDSSHPSIGLEGFSQSGEGVFAQSLSSSFPSLRSVDANALFDVRLSDVPNGDGLTSFLGTTSINGDTAVAGVDTVTGAINNAGVFGFSPDGFGVAGIGRDTSTTSVGVFGVGSVGVFGNTRSTNGIGVFGHCKTSSGPVDEFAGGTAAIINFTVNCAGHVTSTIVTRHQLAATSYTAQTTEPMLEDVGRAQLVDGAASVRLDAAFADAISDRAPYLVFLTPGGDSRGLYVTHRTAYGFDVRENQGGRSTIGFDYRIVAKPADAFEPRMTLSAQRVDPRVIRGQYEAGFKALRLLSAAEHARRAGIYEPRFGADGKLHSAPLSAHTR